MEELDKSENILSKEEIELQENITTKEELFEYIDSKLSEEERQEVMKSDSLELHFGFGTWLRILIIHPGIIDVDYLLNGNDGPSFEVDGKKIRLKYLHPDIASSRSLQH